MRGRCAPASGASDPPTAESGCSSASDAVVEVNALPTGWANGREIATAWERGEVSSLGKNGRAPLRSTFRQKPRSGRIAGKSLRGWEKASSPLAYPSSEVGEEIPERDLQQSQAMSWVEE